MFGEAVLADLKRFCRAQTPTVMLGKDNKIDPLQMALLEGRREVFNRIIQHLNCTDADISRMDEQFAMNEGKKEEFGHE